MVAHEARAAQQAEARDTEGTRTGYGRPGGKSLLGVLGGEQLGEGNGGP